jgi:hypothetical protein
VETMLTAQFPNIAIQLLQTETNFVATIGTPWDLIKPPKLDNVPLVSHQSSGICQEQSETLIRRRNHMNWESEVMIEDISVHQEETHTDHVQR